MCKPSITPSFPRPPYWLQLVRLAADTFLRPSAKPWLAVTVEYFEFSHLCRCTQEALRSRDAATYISISQRLQSREKTWVSPDHITWCHATAGKRCVIRILWSNLYPTPDFLRGRPESFCLGISIITLNRGIMPPLEPRVRGMTRLFPNFAASDPYERLPADVYLGNLVRTEFLRLTTTFRSFEFSSSNMVLYCINFLCSG